MFKPSFLYRNLYAWESLAEKLKTDSDAHLERLREMEPKDFNYYLRLVNSELLKDIECFDKCFWLFWTYSRDTYDANKSSEALLGSLNRLKELYGDAQLPFIYTTQILPSAGSYPVDIWRELRTIDGIVKSSDFGKIDIIKGMIELWNRELIDVTSFNFLYANDDFFVVKIKFKYDEETKMTISGKDTDGKLIFDHSTGEFAFKTYCNRAKFGNKDFVLLSFLNENKNTKFNLNDIIKFCNDKVSNIKHHFRNNKDIDDTLRQIRFKLKLPKGCVFPIRKEIMAARNATWIWYE